MKLDKACPGGAILLLLASASPTSGMLIYELYSKKIEMLH